MMLFKRIITTSVVALAPFSIAHAGFAVAGQSESTLVIPSQVHTSHPNETVDYGRGQVAAFDKAISGTATVTPDEQAYLSRVIRTPINNQWYFSARVGFGKLDLGDIEEDGMATGTVKDTDASETQANFSLGWGYKWHHWRGEVEFVNFGSMDYEPKPVIVGAPTLRNLDTQVTVRALFFNFTRDFRSLYGFHPYIGAGIGAAMQEIDNDLFTTTGGFILSDSTSDLRFAWDVYAGGRVRLSDHFWFDIMYRYASFGETDIVPGEGMFAAGDGVNLKADCLTYSGLSIGINYQIG